MFEFNNSVQIFQLVTGYDSQPLIRQLVDQLDWFVVPLLNPDGRGEREWIYSFSSQFIQFHSFAFRAGYEYSRSSTDPEIRLWRKNRSPVQCTQVSSGQFVFAHFFNIFPTQILGLFSPPQTQCCQGVDLNRNFDWFFGQVGSSSDPCSEIYAVKLGQKTRKCSKF